MPYRSSDPMLEWVFDERLNGQLWQQIFFAGLFHLNLTFKRIFKPKIYFLNHNWLPGYIEKQITSRHLRLHDVICNEPLGIVGFHLSLHICSALAACGHKTEMTLNLQTQPLYSTERCRISLQVRLLLVFERISRDVRLSPNGNAPPMRQSCWYHISFSGCLLPLSTVRQSWQNHFFPHLFHDYQNQRR